MEDERNEARAPRGGIRESGGKGVREEVRQGVREGILETLSVDLDRTSARTAGRLAAAGILGLAAAVGAVVLFSGRALEAGHGWHLAVCAAAWAGLLVEAFAVVLLRVRLRRIPLAQAFALGLLGLGLAAILGLVCPDPHYLDWWESTALGGLAGRQGGPAASALCLGVCSALLVALGATLILALRGIGFRGALLPSLLLFLLLWPAVVLQTVGSPAEVFALWSAGLLAGSYAGVSLALRPARRLRARLTR